MTKTTLTTIGSEASLALTILAGLPDQLGPIAEIIPTQVKSTIITLGLIATVLLRVLHSVQLQNAAVASAAAPPPTPPAAAPKPPGSTAVPIAIIFIIGGAAALAIGACSTNTGDAKKDRTARVTNAVLQDAGDFVGRVALSTLGNIAASQTGGEKIDLAHSAAQGLWSQATTIVSAADVQRVISAWGGGQLDTVAAASAAAFRQAAPATPSDRAAVVNRLAQSISTAALDATGLP